jgi:hypothetical protein
MTDIELVSIQNWFNNILTYCYENNCYPICVIGMKDTNAVELWKAAEYPKGYIKILLEHTINSIDANEKL